MLIIIKYIYRFPPSKIDESVQIIINEELVFGIVTLFKPKQNLLYGFIPKSCKQLNSNIRINDICLEEHDTSKNLSLIFDSQKHCKSHISNCILKA